MDIPDVDFRYGFTESQLDSDSTVGPFVAYDPGHVVLHADASSYYASMQCEHVLKGAIRVRIMRLLELIPC